jgi:hypothetical protein
MHNGSRDAGPQALERNEVWRDSAGQSDAVIADASCMGEGLVISYNS